MKIFITGAAGLIGGELAHRLIQRGHDVTAGVHHNHKVVANDGTLVPVRKRTIIELGAPALGLSSRDARIIASHDLIIHCAATTRFDLPDPEYRRINVEGTRSVVALAETGAVPMIHVSTAYVCGQRDGRIGEGDPLPQDGFANGYEASKAAAETLVATHGIRHVIARPSIVVGGSRTGAIRVFDTIYAAFKLIALGRIRQMPARPGATLDFVPIDHVVNGLCAVVEQIRTIEGPLHLVSATPIPIETFAATIGEYPHFRKPELIAPEAFDPDGLPPSERRLFARIAALYSSYFQRDPRFDDTLLKAQTGLACPATDQAYLRKLIDYCIAVGFLPSA